MLVSFQKTDAATALFNAVGYLKVEHTTLLISASLPQERGHLFKEEGRNGLRDCSQGGSARAFGSVVSTHRFGYHDLTITRKQGGFL